MNLNKIHILQKYIISFNKNKDKYFFKKHKYGYPLIDNIKLGKCIGSGAYGDVYSIKGRVFKDYIIKIFIEKTLRDEGLNELECLRDEIIGSKEIPFSLPIFAIGKTRQGRYGLIKRKLNKIEEYEKYYEEEGKLIEKYGRGFLNFIDFGWNNIMKENDTDKVYMIDTQLFFHSDFRTRKEINNIIRKRITK